MLVLQQIARCLKREHGALRSPNPDICPLHNFSEAEFFLRAFKALKDLKTFRQRRDKQVVVHIIHGGQSPLPGFL
jgi:hypothetical protein